MAFGARHSLAGGLSDNEDTTNRLWNMSEFDPNANPPTADERENTGSYGAEANTPFVFPPMPSPAVARESHRLSYRRSMGRGRRSTFGIGGSSPGDVLARTPGQQARMPRFSTASLLPFSPTSQSGMDHDTSIADTDQGQQSMLDASIGGLSDISTRDTGRLSIASNKGLAYDPFAPRPERRARTRRSVGLALRPRGNEPLDQATLMPSTPAAPGQEIEQLEPGVMSADQLAYAYGDGNHERPEEVGFASLVATHQPAIDFTQSVGSNDVFSMLYCFEQMCHDRQTAINHDLRSSAVSAGAGNAIRRAKHAATLLRQERDTWRLVRALYTDRAQVELRRARGELPEASTLEAIQNRWSESQLVAKLFETNDSVRQYQIVIAWLERIAGENIRYIPDDASWRQTVAELKRGGGSGVPMSANLVTETDPDAPGRQNREPHDDDIEKDKILAANLWRLVRCGRVQDAQELCRQSGQPWRAATLGGPQLYHDPYLAGDANPSQPEGNRTRNIWKSAARAMCDREGLDAHERSLYGVLAGQLDAALTVSTTWADTLWAHFKILVDRHIDAELRMHPNLLTEDQLPADRTHDELFSPADVIEYARAASLASSGLDDRYHTIQEHIILGGDSIRELGNLMTSWVTTGETCPPQLLRFCAHLVLFLNVVGGENQSISDEATRVILQTYAEHLIATNQREIVALYVSRLPADLQSTIYARFLEGVTDSAERDQCLALARQAGLEVTSITKAVVSNIRHAVPEGELQTAALTNQVTDTDVNKIRALEWLCFDPTQRLEALQQSNELLIEFLAQGKVDAAALLLRDVLPADTVSKLQESWTSAIPPREEHVVRQHACLKGLVDAYGAHEQWSQYHAQQPKHPGDAPDPSSLHSVQIQYQHAKSAYDADIGHWTANDARKAATAIDGVSAILTWDNGWMMPVAHTAQLASAGETRRVGDLRKLWLPRLAFMLHRCLHESGQYQRALQVVDLVADERYQVYSVCTQDDLHQLLRLATESQLAVLGESEGQR